MRYVVISDNASVDAIDTALAALQAKLAVVGLLGVTRQWIGEDVDELLDLRLDALATSKAAHHD